METKHTTAPWKVRKEHGLLFVEAPKENLGTSHGQEILAEDYFNEDAKLYDCFLVAAAPELLEALQNMVNLWRGASVSLPLLDEEIAYHKAQEVINKALGKQNG